jgi:hypothetical protein
MPAQQMRGGVTSWTGGRATCRARRPHLGADRRRPESYRKVRAYDRVIGRDADWRTEFAAELEAKW